jgi:Protein of unknown function (DUF4013)
MSDASNPYQSTSAKPPMPSGQMEYMRSFHDTIENPNWLANVLFGGLCILSTNVIPIVGQLVLFGYQFEIIESLHRHPGTRYPDFDMNKIVDYLLRGLWVFFVTLVVSFVMLPIAMIIIGLVVGMSALLLSMLSVAGGEGPTFGVLVATPILCILVIPVFAGIGVISTPLALRAGLMQDFGAAFDFGFAMQFVRNTWKEMVLAAIFLMGAALLATLIGVAMLCIGLYFTMSIVAIMQAHLGLQLYELHLDRGGDPIPLKQLPS